MNTTPNLTLALRLEHLKTSWQQRPRHERLLLTALAALVAVIFAWLLLWLPINASLKQAQTRLPRAAAQLDAATTQWRSAAGLRGAAKTTANGNLKTAVTRLAERFALGRALTGVEESGQQLSCTLSSVSQDTLTQWLAALQREEALFVVSLTLTPLSQPNAMRAELTLGRAQ